MESSRKSTETFIRAIETFIRARESILCLTSCIIVSNNSIILLEISKILGMGHDPSARRRGRHLFESSPCSTRYGGGRDKMY